MSMTSTKFHERAPMDFEPAPPRDLWIDGQLRDGPSDRLQGLIPEGVVQLGIGLILLRTSARMVIQDLLFAAAAGGIFLIFLLARSWRGVPDTYPFSPSSAWAIGYGLFTRRVPDIQLISIGVLPVPDPATFIWSGWNLVFPRSPSPSPTPRWPPPSPPRTSSRRGSSRGQAMRHHGGDEPRVRTLQGARGGRPCGPAPVRRQDLAIDRHRRGDPHRRRPLLCRP